MTPTELRLLSLSKSASEFVSKSGLEVPAFSRPGDWPKSTDFPCQRVVEDDLRLRLTPDPLLRAIALRQKYDPDEQSEWAFVPIPSLNQVWLVRTAQLDPRRN